MSPRLAGCFFIVSANLGIVAPACAASITAIAPSCAAVGSPVTITGNGFDAGALNVTVAGLPATVVSSSTRTAVFNVPSGAGLGPTTVAASNPGSTGSIAFKVCDLLMPASWAGQWQMTVTYIDAATGSTVATNQVTDFIRTAEPFGLAGAANIGSCTGAVSDTQLTVQCSGQGAIATCQVGTNVRIAANLAGDAINGSGTNTTSLSGVCGSFTSSVQNIQIAGARIGTDQNLSGPPLTLLTSFTSFASIVGGGTAVNAASQVTVTGTGFLYGRATHLFFGSLTVRNVTAAAISGPVQIVLTNLTPGVTLANATGTTNGNPFITVPATAGLAANQAASVNVQFNNPSNASIAFTPVPYTGSF